ncbi:hypothetical protein SSX86_011385 [Deinandra increscens subsp. villosa]|uniref:Uncharacterized protein n=1 Tax=Deinandra increscens subsp. villosa TaxID=3103831 RepID=A0AAP0H1X8_9ASTR
MEKLLNEVNTWESTLSSSNPSADMICSGFSHLTALYECLEDLFNSNLSQTSSLFKNDSEKKWTDEILDVSVMLLDECSNTSDVTSQTKQHLRDFGCDLRRNRGCSSESIIAKYTEFRNKLKKEIKGAMGSLKQVENKIRSCPALMVDSENYYHQMWVVSVYREVTAFSIVVFRLLLDFFAIPCLRTRRRGRWTVVSRFLSGGGKVVPEDKADTNGNEFHRLNAALLRYCSSEKQEFVQQAVPKNLEALESALESINSHQHSMSRRLIRTRASILNMVSSY